MLNNLRILAVIPARGGSKGIKLKNIQKLDEVPLISLTARVINELPILDRAVVSTDHPKIVAVAQQAGLDVPFMRPVELSGDVVSDWDVLSHALVTTEAIDGVKYDIIVMLQPTCPLRKPQHVKACIEKLIDGDYDAVWTVSITDSKAHPSKQLTIRGGQLDYYDQLGKNIIARQQLKSVYHRNGAAYAITRECLLAQKSIKGNKTGAVVIDDILISIDTAYDLMLCEFIQKHYLTQ